MEKVKKQKARATQDSRRAADDPRAVMMKMYEDSLHDFKEGAIVMGRVLEVRPNEVLVDIGYKSEGIIPGHEFKELGKVVPGDQFEVLLEKLENDEGMVVVSKKRA